MIVGFRTLDEIALELDHDRYNSTFVLPQAVLPLHMFYVAFSERDEQSAPIHDDAGVPDPQEHEVGRVVSQTGDPQKVGCSLLERVLDRQRIEGRGRPRVRVDGVHECKSRVQGSYS